MTDARYWSSATPRKVASCPSPRRHSKRATVDVYRGEGSRARRKLRREFKKLGVAGFKGWLRMREAA
jgi:hypothetical protein